MRRQTGRLRLSVLITVAALVSGLSAPTDAATVNWVPDADGFWDLATNWSPNLPGVNDDVTINVAGVRTITHRTGSTTIRSLTNAEILLINGGSTLTILLGGANTGTIRTGGATAGTLNLNGGTLTNLGGILQADQGGLINLVNATIQGGTLITSNDGVIRTTPGALGVLDSVTIGANSLYVAGDGSSNTTTRLANTITNFGTLAMNSGVGGGLVTALQLGTDVTLTGTGVLAMADSSGNVISGLNGTQRLTNSAGHAIRGSGSIGAGLMALTNQGLIAATQSTPLIIQPNASGVTNTGGGVLRADGGTLDLRGLFINTGGTIEARNGSTAQLTNATITGGLLLTNSNGVIRTTPGTTGILDSVTLTGLYVAGDGTSNTTTRLANTLVNTGTLAMNSGVGGNNLSTSLVLGNDVTLAGTGTLTMANASSNAISGVTGVERLTNTVDHTIRGSGNIGAAAMALTNAGLIVATQTTPLIVQPNSSGAINTGTLRATDGATLRLIGAFTNFEGATNGLIQALDNPGGAGSIVELSGASITGGVLATTGNSFIRTAPGALGVLDGVTINPNSTYVAGDGTSNTTTRLTTSLANTGTLAMNSTAGANLRTDLVLTNDVTLTGTGVLAMADGSGNVISGLTGTQRLTNSAGHAIRGSGSIGAGLMALTNQGLIAATQSTPLIIQPNASGVTNTGGGVLRADGGTLDLRGLFTNAGGLVEATNSSTLQLTTATVVGGTLTTSNDGVIRTTPGTTSTLDGVTLTGLYVAGDGTSNTTTRLTNTLTNTGTLAMNSGVGGSLITTLQLGTDVTLAGAGSLTMANTTNNFISGQTGTQTLTNAAGHTIQGAGQIQTAIINSGTVRAAGTAGLTVTRGITGPTGTIEIATDGRLTFSGATASSAGTLLHNGSAAGSLSIANTNITVYTDYNNANFGVGNAFNARANVTGTGQILAAGTPAQAQVITGVGVTNGNTTTPMLTIGNVHVGTNTISYQIANNNTGGPATRGAIQTTVGGASITDPRLSGSGVTAGNFGPIAAGSTGSFDVTFTAATAGPLDPLTGQVVRIANNFDNVANQNMTIALRAGAAAYRLAQPGAHTPEPVNLGNIRVGSAFVPQAVSIQNTAPNDRYSEHLNASVTQTTWQAGATTASFTLLAPQETSTGIGVWLWGDMGSATMTVPGEKNGTVVISFVSDGQLTSGLGQTALVGQDQTVNVTGKVFQVAQPTAVAPNPVTLANQRVGGTLTQALTLSNTSAAPAGFQEGLDASFTGTSGNATTTGSVAIVNLGQGGTNSTSLLVGVDTSTAGAKSGTATLALTSNGTGTSGLAPLALASQTVQVSGNVYLQAQPSFAVTTIDLGNVHVGGTATRALAITNTNQAGGFQEGLNATFSGSTAGIATSGGPVTNLAAGASSNALVVGINTGSAGNVNGTATVGLVSNGTVSGLSNLPLSDQVVNVSGNVIAFANPQLTGTLNFGAVAVNSGAVTRTIEVSNVLSAPSASFQELLNAAFGTLTNTGVGSYGTSGAVAGLAAGAPTNTNMVVTFTPGGTAGAISGNVQIQLVSDGTSFGLGTTSLGTQPVTFTGSVTGLVYNQAQGQATPTTVAFGNVRINTAQNQNLTVSNIAPAGSFTEGLNASFGTNTDAATNNGGTIASLPGGAPGNPAASNSTNMVVGLNTTAAGAQSGTATVNFVSDGSIGGTPTAVGSQTINVSGNVYRLGTGSASDVNLGNFRLTAPTNTAALAITNTATADAFSEQVGVQSATPSSGQFTASVNGTARANAGGPAVNAVTVGLGSGLQVGVNSGSVSIQYLSDGTASGTGSPIVSNSQTVNVQAAGYNVAVGSAAPSPIALGNFRVGRAGGAVPQSQGIAVTNTVAGPFTESLGVGAASVDNAAFTLTNNLGSGLIAAGATTSDALSIARTGGSAGLNTGTLAIQYTSDGAGTSGLAAINSNAQNITVTATGYNLASGAINTAPLNFGTVQVGQTVQQTLSISNVATGPAGFVEDLNASFGATSGTGAGLIGGIGSITGLAAGGTNTTGMTVTVNTSAATTINGAIAVNFFSAGAVGGVSNDLGVIGVGSANYGVAGTIEAQGQVVNQAAPVINTPTVALGNVRVGDASPTGVVSVTNQATVAPQAALNASISAEAPLTATGSFALLDPGATNGTALQVGMSTATAGARNGTATVAFVSDASNIGGCAPNCQLTLASQTVNVTGGVYQIAQPTLASATIDVGATRMGGTAQQALSITNTNVAPAGFQEGLSAALGSATSGVTAAGAFTNLAAGGTNSTALLVGVDTTTAGVKSGTATLALTSTGQGTSGLADLALASQTVSITGKVYTPAVASVAPTTLTFGIVHVGDSVAVQTVGVTNAAPSTALNDVLRGGFATAAVGPFATTGTLGAGLGAGESGSAITVGLSTASAGVYSSSATLLFQSHNADMADLALASQSVHLVAQVNNYARPVFEQVAGGFALTQSGSTFTLDFGDLLLGSGLVTAGLGVRNDVAGPADLLGGTFDLGAGSTAFAFTGFDPFQDLLAGALFGGLGVSVDTATLGLFDYSLVLSPYGMNASSFFGALGDLTLALRANVVASTAVPEPSTLLLLGTGLAGLAGWRWRTRGRRDE